MQKKNNPKGNRGKLRVREMPARRKWSVRTPATPPRHRFIYIEGGRERERERERERGRWSRGERIWESRGREERRKEERKDARKEGNNIGGRKVTKQTNKN